MYRYDEFDEEFVRERVAQFRGQVARRLDGSMGRVLEALEESSFSENTLVVFLSDNGGCSEQFPGDNTASCEFVLGSHIFGEQKLAAITGQHPTPRQILQSNQHVVIRVDLQIVLLFHRLFSSISTRGSSSFVASILVK